MRKLIYIFVILIFYGCFTSKYEKGYSSYKDYFLKYSNKYLWEGKLNNDSYKITIDSCKSKDHGKLIINIDTVLFEGFQKWNVYYLKTISKENKGMFIFIESINSDVIVIREKSNQLLNIEKDVVLKRKERKYFFPYFMKNLISKTEFIEKDRISIKLQNSSPIIAISKGKVIKINKRCGNGQYIQIKHDNGLISMYSAQYSKIKVKEKDVVEKGEVIGITSKDHWDSGNFTFVVLKDSLRINPKLIFEKN